MSAPPSAVAGALAEGAFLLVDKPRGPTSHQVTAWVRDLLGVARAGHAGTLDPNVSGLLWIGVGPALKLLPLLLDFPKRYVGVVAFHGRVDAAALARTVAEFTGPVYQTPPVRSAVRRERRVRRIHRLTVIERRDDAALLDVVAESGTYVRTLAVDLGDALGVGAHLAELRRIGTGPFREEAAVPVTAVADAVARAREGAPAELAGLLHPLAEVWGEFPQLVVKPAAAAAIAHGAGLARGGIVAASRPFAAGALVVVVGPGATLLGFGRALAGSDDLGGHRTGWVVRPERVTVDAARFPLAWKSAPADAGPPPG